MTEPRHLGVVELADRCGALAWVADSLFSLEGRWSSTLATPGAVEHLAVHSRYHGWHCGLWRELLPDSPALDGPSRENPPPGWQAAMELAARQDEAGDEASRLAVLYRGLVPRAAAMVDELIGVAVGPGDVAASRVARLVAADHSSDLVGGSQWLANALRDEESVERAGRAVSALDLAFSNL